ncbi:hypothetical protein KC361_g8711 [Hortaea werneckii]|nr:hypothetical protein KC361_g8711 [Hortaea werneckii]
MVESGDVYLQKQQKLMDVLAPFVDCAELKLVTLYKQSAALAAEDIAAEDIAAEDTGKWDSLIHETVATKQQLSTALKLWKDASAPPPSLLFDR